MHTVYLCPIVLLLLLGHQEDNLTVGDCILVLYELWKASSGPKGIRSVEVQGSSRIQHAIADAM